MKAIRGFIGFFRRRPVAPSVQKDDLYCTENLGVEAAWPAMTDHAPMP